MTLMGESPRAEADHLSPGQRSTIRRAIQDAIDAHGIEWAMRNTCAELEKKYGITYDTIEYLLSDELPAALPEELLTTGQKNRIRREFHAAMSVADLNRRNRAAAEVVKNSKCREVLAAAMRGQRPPRRTSHIVGGIKRGGRRLDPFQKTKRSVSD